MRPLRTASRSGAAARRASCVLRSPGGSQQGLGWGWGCGGDEDRALAADWRGRHLPPRLPGRGSSQSHLPPLPGTVGSPRGGSKNGPCALLKGQSRGGRARRWPAYRGFPARSWRRPIRVENAEPGGGERGTLPCPRPPPSPQPIVLLHPISCLMQQPGYFPHSLPVAPFVCSVLLGGQHQAEGYPFTCSFPLFPVP